MSKYRTKSLFHYTKEMNSLLEIIKSGILYPNFCKEDLSTKKNPNYILGIPEICFCDIPISMANKFRDNYGFYAIGFDKYWGINNGCNPLLYVANESIIDGAIHYKERVRTLRKNIIDEIVIRGILSNIKEFLDQLSRLKGSVLPSRLVMMKFSVLMGRRRGRRKWRKEKGNSRRKAIT